MINEFKGKYSWLSNFYECKVIHEGIEYKNSEAAFQAAKCITREYKLHFTNLTGKEAKHLGRSVTLRKDWQFVKDKIMYDIVKDKFTRNQDLKEKLVATQGELIEGNIWGDTYWGVCDGNGYNILGKILMKVREELGGEKQYEKY